MIKWLARWTARRPIERRALVEAAGLLVLASAIVRLSRFSSVMRLAAWPMGRVSSVGDDAENLVAWAVGAAARRARFRAVCIEQGLAAQIMLRRRGIDSRLHYGVRKTSDGALEAHVWVTAAARPVIGCENAQEFTLLATFPQMSATGPIVEAPTRNA